MVGNILIHMAKGYLIYIAIFAFIIACSIFSSIQSGDDTPVLIFAWGIEHLPHVGFIFCLYLLYKHINKQNHITTILFLLAIHVSIIIWMQLKFGPYW